jgi:hypothetical protein
MIETQPLTEESKTKVCIIEDLNKIYKYRGYDPFPVHVFDWLYDKPLEELDNMLLGAMEELSRQQFKMEFYKNNQQP